MDVIGAVGAIVGIVDVVSRTVLTLRDIKARLDGADAKLVELIGELTAIKAALSHVKGLIEDNANEDVHYQFVMDLEDTLGCCLPLVQLIDDRVMQAGWHEGETSLEAFKNKIALVLRHEDTMDALARVNRMLTALNTLILAYNRWTRPPMVDWDSLTLSSRSPVSQGMVLRKTQSRKIFQRIQDDSSSLRALHDGEAGHRSVTTIATSKLSFLCPGLDGELLRTRAYDKLFRRLHERARRASDISREGVTAAIPRRTRIGKPPTKLDRRGHFNVHVLILGSAGPVENVLAETHTASSSGGQIASDLEPKCAGVTVWEFPFHSEPPDCGDFTCTMVHCKNVLEPRNALHRCERYSSAFLYVIDASELPLEWKPNNTHGAVEEYHPVESAFLNIMSLLAPTGKVSREGRCVIIALLNMPAIFPGSDRRSIRKRLKDYSGVATLADILGYLHANVMWAWPATGVDPPDIRSISCSRVADVSRQIIDEVRDLPTLDLLKQSGFIS